MASLLLDRAFARFITAGRLEIHYPDGERRVHVGHDGPYAAMRIADHATGRALLLNPALKVGEAYMAGTLWPVGCTLYDLLHVLMLNVMASAPAGERVLAPLRHMGRRLWRNTQPRARRNVAHHYDLDSRLYRHFLDEDMQYSCGYFPTGEETLAQAQAAKKHHLAAKLHLVRPGMSVLDVGCGWGGMALTLARDYGAVVTGITLSAEQLQVARGRAREAGLEHRVHFELLDYRALAPRQYDRIISIGMFEHVGVAHYPAFFAAMREALRPDGVMVLHSIGRREGPGVTNPWIARHIFPGGYSPSVSEAVAAVEKAGLWLTDCEIWRLHYARTIAHWRSRFTSQRAQVARLYGERFCRMFEFYLVVSELAFRVQGHLNFQLQLTRDLAAVPLTRDYMQRQFPPPPQPAMAQPWAGPRYAAAALRT